ATALAQECSWRAALAKRLRLDHLVDIPRLRLVFSDASLSRILHPDDLPTDASGQGTFAFSEGSEGVTGTASGAAVPLFEPIEWPGWASLKGWSRSPPAAWRLGGVPLEARVRVATGRNPLTYAVSRRSSYTSAPVARWSAQGYVGALGPARRPAALMRCLSHADAARPNLGSILSGALAL